METEKDLSPEELKLKYKMIYGGVAWPGQRKGCAVVAAMGRKKHFDNYNNHILAEYESFDTRELVKQCGVLNYKYQPARWFGDNLHDAADRFIQETNREQNPENSDTVMYIGDVQRWRPFQICSTPILDMKKLYSYIIPEIKRLLDDSCKRLIFQEDSSIREHFRSIRGPSEIATLVLGDYPAIEALAFAVLELRRYGTQIDLDLNLPVESDIAGSYTIRTNV